MCRHCRENRGSPFTQTTMEQEEETAVQREPTTIDTLPPNKQQAPSVEESQRIEDTFGDSMPEDDQDDIGGTSRTSVIAFV